MLESMLDLLWMVSTTVVDLGSLLGYYYWGLMMVSMMLESGVEVCLDGDLENLMMTMARNFDPYLDPMMVLMMAFFQC